MADRFSSRQNPLCALLHIQQPLFTDINEDASSAHGDDEGEFCVKLLEEMAGNVTVVEAHGRLDSIAAKEFGNRLTALVQAGRSAILVDLKNIAYISSTGFHVLLTANRATAERQGKLALCGVIGEVRRLFEIGAFNELFLICHTRADGIDMLKQ